MFAFPTDSKTALPAPERFVVGTSTTINGKPFSVASNLEAMLVSAQGELPKLPALGEKFRVVELRGDNDVLSLDFGSSTPMVSRGVAVQLDDLQLKGLKESSTKEEKGRQFSCPHCGAPVTVALANSKSITCGSCNSLIDLTAGLGGELRSAEQDEPIRPLIPLGTVGDLQGTKWQVVGFQHRMGVAPGDDEHFGWSEYLLYNQKKGFSFLVDSED